MCEKAENERASSLGGMSPGWKWEAWGLEESLWHSKAPMGNWGGFLVEGLNGGMGQRKQSPWGGAGCWEPWRTDCAHLPSLVLGNVMHVA